MKRLRHGGKWLFLFLFISIPLFGANKAWQVKAPGGSEADLETNISYYYGTSSEQVELSNEDGALLFADRLTYKEKEEDFHAEGHIDMVKKQPKLRRIIGNELFYNSLTEDFSLPSGGRVTFGPEQSVLTADEIKGNLKRENFVARNNCRYTDPDGILTSVQMDGDMISGVFNAHEQVVFVGKKATIRSENAVYYQKEERAIFKDKPVATQDKKTFTATEIIYDMKNKHIKALGPVRYISPGDGGSK
ncbi:MAG TPA: LptA/OstA family protein [Bacillota bacterium]|nr:LptA/OstA family protein [Bacillota bacterium]